MSAHKDPEKRLQPINIDSAAEKVIRTDTEMTQATTQTTPTVCIHFTSCSSLILVKTYI